MRAVVQRVSKASVEITGTLRSEIKTGFLILLGIEASDTTEDVEWLVNKITQLRIFADNDGKMNLSLKDINGELLVVSQFTLFASTKKGNRPGFTRSANPEIAIPLYEAFIEKAESVIGKKVSTGEFGASMDVNLINNGPVTIIIDTKNKE